MLTTVELLVVDVPAMLSLDIPSFTGDALNVRSQLDG